MLHMYRVNLVHCTMFIVPKIISLYTISPYKMYPLGTTTLFLHYFVAIFTSSSGYHYDHILHGMKCLPAPLCLPCISLTSSLISSLFLLTLCSATLTGVLPSLLRWFLFCCFSFCCTAACCCGSWDSYTGLCFSILDSSPASADSAACVGSAPVVSLGCSEV